MDLSVYNKNNQIEWLELTLTKGTQVIDILQLMDQYIGFEDIFQPSYSARLIFRDQMNLVGALPIVGGEKIKMRYRTPVYSEITTIEMIVYKVGDRGIPISSENIQINQLYLCTPELWWSVNNNTEGYFKGTYSDIITKVLAESGSKKPLDKEESIGIVEYVAPSTDLFSAAKFCASRANSKTLSPMFFWETPAGFKFKSLKELYRGPQNKFLYIEDRSVSGADTDADKVFNTVYDFEYLESNDRLDQYKALAFGTDHYLVDFTNARVFKTTNSYDDVFNKLDIKLNKFPLNDPMKNTRNLSDYSPYRKDLSHLSAFNRTSNLALMDNLKVMVNIPGDSQLKTGDVVWLEIPSRVGLSIGKEAISSGKWLLRSAKHLITKTTYTMTCELTKDSFDADVNKQGS